MVAAVSAAAGAEPICSPAVSARRASGKMPAMKLLAIETSTDYGTCALWQDGVLEQRACPPGRPHSETLLPLVRELLAGHGLALAQLDALAFGVGPGAFTGLRVACGVVQGLAVGAGLPVVPVCGLEAMALETGAARVLSLLDARMGEVYAAVCESRDGDWRVSGEISVGPPAAVAVPDAGIVTACGNALRAYPELAARLRAGGVTLYPEILPQAGAIVRLAAQRLAQGEAGIDPALAAPLYVRDKVAKTIRERLEAGGKA